MSGEMDAILIAGPTASGKSALAIELAKALGATVFNADSMQIYRDLRILTARPLPEEEARAPHRLFGVIDASVNFSVGEYIRTIEDELNGGFPGIPIFTGGTGLYFKALTEGLSIVPSVPDAVREEWRKKSEGAETGELHGFLAASDPETASTLRSSDRLRILRALEVFSATGRSLVSFHGERRPGPLNHLRLLKIFLAPDREDVRRRINARFLAMMEQGALNEVKALKERKLDPLLPAMRAHGVPSLMAHLEGRCSLDEAIAKGQADTRAYAKRQFTFFRHQVSGWDWIAPEQGFDQVLRMLKA